MSEVIRNNPHEGMPKTDIVVLAQQVAGIVSNYEGTTNLNDLLIFSPRAHIGSFARRRKHNESINPPPGWRDFLDGLSSQERSILTSIIGRVLRAGLQTLDDIRNMSVEEIAAKQSGKRIIGNKTANLIKTAFGQIPQKE
ncbi:MAG: hypothetical protein HYU48_01815 [Candidatus Levybacteria bacterium]|nr:hypothetical protein [Candidatus Levybacteria bacterium]